MSKVQFESSMPDRVRPSGDSGPVQDREDRDKRGQGRHDKHRPKPPSRPDRDSRDDDGRLSKPRSMPSADKGSDRGSVGQMPQGNYTTSSSLRVTSRTPPAATGSNVRPAYSADSTGKSMRDNPASSSSLGQSHGRGDWTWSDSVRRWVYYDLRLESWIDREGNRLSPLVAPHRSRTVETHSKPGQASSTSAGDYGVDTDQGRQRSDPRISIHKPNGGQPSSSSGGLSGSVSLREVAEQLRRFRACAEEKRLPWRFQFAQAHIETLASNAAARDLAFMLFRQYLQIQVEAEQKQKRAGSESAESGSSSESEED